MQRYVPCGTCVDGPPDFDPSQASSSNSQSPAGIEPDHEDQIRILQDERVRRRVIYNRQLRENDPTVKPEVEIV